MEPRCRTFEDLRQGLYLGDFRLRRQLLAGEGLVVWSGINPLSGDKVRVTFLCGEDRLSQAALADALDPLCRLECPSVVRLRHYGLLDQDQTTYLVHDAVQGESLADFEQRGQLAADGFEIAESLVQTLAVLHDFQATHGALNAEAVHIIPRGDHGLAPLLRFADVGVALAAGRVSTSFETAARTDRLACVELIERITDAPEHVCFALREAASTGHAGELALILEQHREELANDRPITLSLASPPPVSKTPMLESTEPAEKPAEEETIEQPVTKRSSGGRRFAWSVAWIAMVAITLVGTYRILTGTFPWHVEAPPKTGKLSIRTTPEGATVYVRGRKLGKTPLSISLERGHTVDLELSRAGYRPWHQAVALGVAEQTRVLRVDMVRAGDRWGSLLLTTSEAADVFLDTRRVGRNTKRVQLADVRADVSHKLIVRARGFRKISRQIRVKAGKVTVLRFDLERELSALIPKD